MSKATAIPTPVSPPDAGSSVVTPWVSAVIAGARQRDIQARRSGHMYRIFVSRPLLPPPAEGYPVIYMLDANSAFGTIAEAVRVQSARPHATRVAPAVVVGIGYPTELPLDLERRTLDYTPDVDHAALSSRPDGTPWPPTGGAGAFLDFIEAELKPMIARELPVDATRQVLIGHSFGGLFTLFALFERPGTFRYYVAGSPSIWFGNCAILKAETRFSERFARQCIDVGLMIGVGALEQTLAANDTPTSPRAAWVTQNRMVDNAREMGSRLQALQPCGLQLAYEEFPGENHVSVIPGLISRSLRFAIATT